MYKFRSRLYICIEATIIGDLVTRAAEWWYGVRYPCALTGRRNISHLSTPKGGVLVIAAHPDDEVLGLAFTLMRHRTQGDRVVVVFSTNGAGGYWRDGLPDKGEVPARRFSEACNALGIIGIPASDIACLGFPDGGLRRYLREAARDVAQILRDYAPRIVYVHALEGGHPDHDLTSYIVQTTCRKVGILNVHEWCEYNRDIPFGHRLIDARFARDPYVSHFDEQPVEPPDTDGLIKQRMLNEYASQVSLIVRYPFRNERLRKSVPERLLPRLRYFTGFSGIRLRLLRGHIT